MPFAGTSHRPLVGAGAVLGVLALIAGTVAWWGGGASATPGRPAVAATTTTVPEPTTSSSTTSTSTSTTTSTTTSTSTTVKPKPVTTTTPRVPRTTPATAPPTTPAPVAPAASGTSPAERCATAQRWVAAQGLPLPPGWGFRCPGPAVVLGTPRWGLACWNCEGTGSWIAIDIARIGPSDATLRHVIAHETCHANEYMTLGFTTEPTADLCAGLHGAPRP